MAVPEFNGNFATGEDDDFSLAFANNGFDGALADTGNTVNVIVQPISPVSVESYQLGGAGTYARRAIGGKRAWSHGNAG